MALHSDVIVIGGGIVGSATSYYLSKQGIKVTQIDTEGIAKFASGLAAGILNPLDGHGVPSVMERFANQSYNIHAPLTEELGETTNLDPQFSKIPCLLVATEQLDYQVFESLRISASRFDSLSMEWISLADAFEIEKRLSPNILGVARIESIIRVSSYDYTLALAKAAEINGATFIKDTISTMHFQRNKVVSVQTSNADFHCNKVVLCTGPWLGKHSSNWFNLQIPVTPLKGQIIRFNLPGQPMNSVIYTNGGDYMCPKSDGLVWAGTTEEPVGFDFAPTVLAKNQIVHSLSRIMPSVSQVVIKTHTACLRPHSADGLPVIGEIPGKSGVYVAGGAGRKGILLGPAIGKAISQIISHGKTDFDIGAFSPLRFI